ncbi:hypothetical protein VTO42DRAFT_2077 [Malbranchea cinnamomea]
MVSASDNDRAVQLAREAVELVDAGHGEAASRNLREAIALAPDNAEVKSAFLKIQEIDQAVHPLLHLCRRYITQNDEEAGKEAARFLRTEGLEPPPDTALECLNLILSRPAAKLSNMQDDIISGLVRQSGHIRRHFAAELQKSVTTFFDEIYERGDASVVCLDTIVLDTSLWQSESVRMHCESELFQLFIAKLMESGHDLDGRSLKGIARLLVVDADRLKHLVDEEGFDVILASLDLRLPADVRSQATLATAKYLEAAKEEGEGLFSKLMIGRVTRKRNDDLIIAFSAAAAVFPLVPATAATLFLTEGFLQSLTVLLDRRNRSNKIVDAVLELFNAASTDRACRDAIAKHHADWLSHILSNGTDRQTALAAVILAKIRASGGSSSEQKSESNDLVKDLVRRFRESASGQQTDANLRHLVEGLAYSSVKPKVKEQLSKDAEFLKRLFAVLKTHTDDMPVLYGGLTIISNLTKYLPNLSEEQKKMSELKAYANTTKPTVPDELDNDDHVKDRCTLVIEAGVVPLLVECGKSTLSSVLTLTSKIARDLSKNARTRGQLAQQGAVKLLISLATRKGNNSCSPADEITSVAAHALARVLISVNPDHVFPASGFPQATSAVRPLVQLLTPPKTNISADQPLDLLPVFESLLALTNLASSPRNGAAETIVRVGWAVVEDLLLSSHTYIQRASCELACNLMTCEKGVSMFIDGSSRAGQRLHILVALADAEDVPTRRAAGGALAMLTEFDAAVKAVLDRPRGVDVILGLCSDEDESIVHRGVVCVHNLVHAAEPNGSRARSSLLQKNAIECLKGCLRKSRNTAVLQSGVEALKVLIGSQAA